MGAGFLNCTPLRALAANAGLLNRPLLPTDLVTIPDLDPGGSDDPTDQRHVFVLQTAPPVSIRLVHGSPNIPYLQDAETTILHISNHQTTRGGLEDDTTLPATFGFQDPGHADPDTFKVEVVDPQAGSPLTTVKLEALRRVLRPDGTFGHDPFPGAERARRSLPAAGAENLQCDIVSSGVAFRSRYLRLVTDETDKAALPNQTLLVTDMTDQGDDTVEILEQAVRATYVLQRCPAALCEVSRTIPVGLTDAQRPSRITGPTNSVAETKPRNFLNIAVHILNATAGGGNPIVPIADADRRVKRWVRRMWAQAGLAPRLIQATRIVDPQNNLVAIGDPGGLTATGGGQMSFRINAPGHPSQDIAILTVAGDTPAVTAAAIAQRVNAPFTAAVTINPAGFNDPVGNRSADVLITAPGGALVTIDREVSGDPRQSLAVGRPDPTLLPGFSNDFLIGSIEQRTIMKNYDTGEDRIDVFVIQRFTDPDPAGLGDRGQAMLHGISLSAPRAAIEPVRFSVFISQRAINAGDGNPASLPHEMGHVLMDVIHAVTGRFRQELMADGGTSAAIAENATKRIKERLKNFDGRNAGAKRQLDLVHQRGGGLLDAF